MVDIVIGKVINRPACSFIADLLAIVLNDELERTTRTIAFATADTLFANLTQDIGEETNRVNLTPCFVDPDDREFILTYSSQLALFGEDYGRAEGKKLYVAAHSGLPPTLEFNDSCIYDFLHRFKFDDEVSFVEQEATSWIAQNRDIVGSWLQCKKS